jgi:predicted aspartyl protease
MASYKIKIDVREIEKKNYHLFIDLKVGGKPCRLLLDTGASKTVLDAGQILKFVKEDKIKLHESKSVGLGVSEMETKVAKLKDLKIGKAEFKELEVAVLDIAHVNETYRLIEIPEIDGVLGSDFLMKYDAVINYNKAILKITLP